MITRLQPHRKRPVLARGDDPPEPPATLARGDDPPEPPATLARLLASWLPAGRRRARPRLATTQGAALYARRCGPTAMLRAANLLRGADLVVVDVETTGWLDDHARITEIGAVRLSADRQIAEFSTLVNPEIPIPAHITELTGITDAMVREAPVIGAALPRFLEFAGGSVIAAHNAPFDIGFLTAACDACGVSWPPRAVVDTAVLSRMALGSGEVPDHKLSTLASHFGAASGPCHRALADARATLDVLAGLLELLAEPKASGYPRAKGRGAAFRGGRNERRRKAAPQERPEASETSTAPRRRARRPATMAPQPGRGLPATRRRLWLWSRRSC